MADTYAVARPEPSVWEVDGQTCLGLDWAVSACMQADDARGCSWGWGTPLEVGAELMAMVIGSERQVAPRQGE